MNIMDFALSTVLQQIYPALLVVDQSGIIRFVSPQFSESYQGQRVTELLPQLQLPLQNNNGSQRQGPVQLQQQGAFYYQIFSISQQDFSGFCLVFQRDNEQQSLQKKNDHMQQLLYHSEKMAVIGQLTTSITHEINNPVGYVYSNMQTLSDYASDLIKTIEALSEAGDKEQAAAIKAEFDFDYISADIHSLLKESGFGLEQVLSQIAALKDLSHSDELHFQLADIQTGIRSSIRIVHNDLKYKVTIHQELAPLPLIECIPSQLYQVVLNLLVNAGQAITEQGDIYIRTGTEADRIWIEVQDTGSGITAQHLDKIFEPFFTTKAVGKGTGLGLALCKNIIDRHHGVIEVRSEPGVGSSFKIWLPIKQP
ncbi:sensor histidine kinase [Rheinheimera sp.]|uniref:sensor histidine kinase n=1 Tax=Rheinheimera sp. TaxID=1869214 RepID=UPI0027B9CF8C|nr:ATP-binding protein [Rheinheimera sp.]